IGGVLVGLGWIGSGYATSVHGLIGWYTLGGVGAGVVYGGTVGNAMKWFPDHRGLCVGLTAAAYGAQRRHAPVLRLGVGPRRPREHDVRRLHAGSFRGLPAPAPDRPARLLHRALRALLFRLGRDLLALPLDHWRSVRPQVVHGQLRRRVPPRAWPRSSPDRSRRWPPR